MTWFLATSAQDDVRAWATRLPLHDLPEAFQATLASMTAVEGEAKGRAALAVRVMAGRSVDAGQPWVTTEAIVGAIRTVVDEANGARDRPRLELARTAALLAAVPGVPTEVASAVLAWLRAVAQACQAAGELDDVMAALLAVAGRG